MKHFVFLAAGFAALALVLAMPEAVYSSPPSNDDFANATVVGALPFSDSVFSTEATTETDEILGCGNSYTPRRTVWYSITPDTTVTLRADMNGSTASWGFNVWQANGPGWAGLSYVTCGSSGGPSTVTFLAAVATTYYFQAEAWDTPLDGTLDLHVQALLPPSNDNFADATAISSFPFSETVGISQATVENGEPLDYPSYQTQTVWYSFTAAESANLRADLGGSDGYPFANVYRSEGAGFAGLTKIAGHSWYEQFTFPVEAGGTYYIQGGSNYYWWNATAFGINLSVIAPPANDDFADAIAFTSVPFSASADLTAATVEPGEPISCGASFTQSAWYAFTPATSGSYGAYGVSNVAVYTGTSLSDLTNVACADWPGLYFWAEAGATYYLQTWGGGGVSVDVVPPPAADFTYSPGDPSAVEDIAFSYWNGGYWDPTVTGYSWNFGDGTTGTGSPASHKFARDGNYEVTITVEARGGRTNTATKTVQIRTHDVTILSLVGPKKGVVDKQGTITVDIGNTRYPETVQVDLYKVTPQGDVLVGTNIQAVAVMKLKKAVTFSFNYFFTGDDAALGKVPFKAVATLPGLRDAVNSDNVATSPPTLVTR